MESATPYTLHLDDRMETLRAMPDGSVDSVVTDPPYGLEFMGKDWDAPWKTDRRQVFDGTLTDVRPNPFGRSKVRYGTGASYGAGVEPMQGFQLWAKAIFSECLRVLKPGGHMLSFGGSRTYHRMACAVEDAGFEIRDQIMWIYGSGFPKSHNGEWGGTALKPAHEPIVVARKPLVGTVKANWRENGTGALNIDGCRVPTAGSVDDAGYRAKCASVVGLDSNRNGTAYGEWSGQRIDSAHAAGRWPANVLHDGSDEVLAAFPATAPSRIGKPRGSTKPGDGWGMTQTGAEYNDTGSAARFFYCAKASKADREEGNTHPTVKPTDLMRYLCRLVTPPGGVVLDPFMGSGSTGKAAMLEGFRFIGCERETEYLEIARARIAHACASIVKSASAPDPRTDLFA